MQHTFAAAAVLAQYAKFWFFFGILLLTNVEKKLKEGRGGGLT